ncbi:structure-specific endonuclease subunit SLX4 isoform X3 [Stomoxys calcitrans]|uniref:structure-specific endonuclease subunit SLX4 isoform X3 n=1 Tax=Stomoxys calcitrans TaxID=35570 RepID=UPI0027E36CE3|nr:structure-specific endonuclease subunit SLX4 isoform X3 [Stomoxys calcitrans]
MDRATRKANLKKLQLPGTTGLSQRKSRQNAKTQYTTAISDYFLSPQQPSKQSSVELEESNKEHPANNSEHNTEIIPTEGDSKRLRPKRAKLDEFVFKQPQTIEPDSTKQKPKCLNDDDFDLPEKKARKAPQPKKTETSKSAKAKSSKKKKQTTIKSAFLRNEQLFAEIAAQHCAADNFDGDDVQLAIAISKSEAESKGLMTNDVDDMPVADIKESEKNAESIKQKLEKYGFRTADKEDYSAFTTAFMTKSNNRSKKSKWANKFTALTLRDEEVQRKKLQEHIDDILNKHSCSRSIEEVESQALVYHPQSRLLKSCQQKTETNVLHLPEVSEVPHDKFFVNDLFEVSNLSAGHLLKNWSAIQGRDFTPKKQGPYSQGLAAKMRKIYKELEEYFQSLNNSSGMVELKALAANDRVTAIVEDPESVELNVDKYFKSISLPKEIETAEDPERLGENSNTLEIMALMPPNTILDLINSNSTIKSNGATMEHITQNTENSTSILKNYCPTSQIIANERHAGNDCLKSSNQLETYETIVLSGSSATSTNSKEEKSAPSFENTLGKKGANCDISLKNYSSNTANCIIEKNPCFKDVSATPTQGESTINNSTQKNRSNSPDLFADSDVEMEERSDVEEVFSGSNHSNKIHIEEGNRVKSVAGITTYELYSSDEVKNALPLKLSDQLGPQENETKPNSEQDEEEENTFRSHSLNHSKAIVEVDLFADSPLSEEEKEGFSIISDINSNSQASKYLENNLEATFKFSLDSYTNGDTNEQKRNFYTFSLSIEPEQRDENVAKNNHSPFQISDDQQTTPNGRTNNKDHFPLEFKDHEDCGSYDDVLFGDAIQSHKEKRTLVQSYTAVGNKKKKKEGNHTSIDDKNECKDFTLSMQTLRRCNTKNLVSMSQNKPFSLSLLESNDSEEEEEEDVLREIEVNQTNSSFLNFQGSNQLQTCFHRETATIKEPQADAGKPALRGNDTIFQELYNKYLGGKSSEQNRSGLKSNEKTFRKSYSQRLPSPQELCNETSFSMDLAALDFRKSVSFHNKPAEEKSINHTKAGHCKSQSFTNISIDLTQVADDDDGEAVAATSRLPITTPTPGIDNEICFNMDLPAIDNRKSLSFQNKSADEKSLFPTKARLSKSHSFSMQNLSIDLTQVADDDDCDAEAPATGAMVVEDDNCLVLSDDEINYSIWKADKTENFKNFEEDESESENIMSLENPNTNFINKESTNLKSKCNNLAGFSPCSYSDFEVKSPKLISQQLERSHFGILEEFSEPYSDYELKSPKINSQKLERSHFGIMDEQSQPIDFIPSLYATTTNILEEASFLQSPSELMAPMMKRYSNANKSTNKFKDLLSDIKDVDAENHTNLDDYDEFDRMLYQNQLNKATTSLTAGLPQGFDRLMTAEISLNESQETSKPTSQGSSVEIIEENISSSYKPSAFDSSDSQLQEVNINNKIYTICNATVPKPNYALYTEAELLKELYNYGIKPLKRKQAVKMLEYIYIQTHPIIVDDDEMPKKPTNSNEPFAVPSSSKCGVKIKNTISASSCLALSTLDVNKECGGSKLNLRDGCGSDMLRHSCDLKAELCNEQYILQTNVTKKTPQPLMPFHIAWYNLVCCNRSLHESILMYEPIDLQEIYLFLKSLGYRYDPKDLKQFFDRRCIIFRYDLASAGGGDKKENNKNRHTRKNKKAGHKAPIFISIP